MRYAPLLLPPPSPGPHTFYIRSERQVVDDMAHVDGFSVEVVARGGGDKEDCPRNAADLRKGSSMDYRIYNDLSTGLDEGK